MPAWFDAAFVATVALFCFVALVIYLKVPAMITKAARTAAAQSGSDDPAPVRSRAVADAPTRSSTLSPPGDGE